MAEVSRLAGTSCRPQLYQETGHLRGQQIGAEESARDLPILSTLRDLLQPLAQQTGRWPRPMPLQLVKAYGGTLWKVRYSTPFDIVALPPDLFPQLVREEILSAIERRPSRLQPFRIVWHQVGPA